jgi:hypothetical protein
MARAKPKKKSPRGRKTALGICRKLYPESPATIRAARKWVSRFDPVQKAALKKLLGSQADSIIKDIESFADQYFDQLARMYVTTSAGEKVRAKALRKYANQILSLVYDIEARTKDIPAPAIQRPIFNVKGYLEYRFGGQRQFERALGDVELIGRFCDDFLDEMKEQGSNKKKAAVTADHKAAFAGYIGLILHRHGIRLGETSHSRFCQVLEYSFALLGKDGVEQPQHYLLRATNWILGDKKAVK